MSTTTTTNLGMTKDNADEPIKNHRGHINSALDTIDGQIGTINGEISTINGEIDALGESVSLNAKFLEGQNVRFSRGDGAQHILFWFVCTNPSSPRYGHDLALVIHDGGIGMYDGTAKQDVFANA